MSKLSFPLVAIENVKWRCIAVYCNFNHNEPFWGHYWGLYNAWRCIIWCFFFQFKDFFLLLQGEKNVFISLPLFIRGLAGLPGPTILFPLGQGTLEAARGSQKGQAEQWVCHLPQLWPDPLHQPLAASTPAWPHRLLCLPPPFSILTKALYRIVLITFRC